MDSESFKNGLLWDAVDDWYGLWEAFWGARTEAPELTDEAAFEMATSALTDLVLDELIYLCWFDEGANSEAGVMSRKEALEVLAKPECWEPVARFPKGQIRYAATEKVWARAE